MIFWITSGFGFKTSGVTLIDDLGREDFDRGELIYIPGENMLMPLGVEEISEVLGVVALGIPGVLDFGVAKIFGIGFPRNFAVAFTGKVFIWVPDKVFF